MPVMLAPVRAIAIAGELIRAALPKLSVTEEAVVGKEARVKEVGCRPQGSRPEDPNRAGQSSPDGS